MDDMVAMVAGSVNFLRYSVKASGSIQTSRAFPVTLDFFSRAAV